MTPCKPLPASLTTILFDLDGTLVDSRELIRRSLQQTVQEYLDLIPSEEELHRFTGVPLMDIMAHYDTTRAKEMAERYRVVYDEIQGSHLFPGILDLLDVLHRRGYAMAVVTTKGRGPALSHLAEHALEAYFPVVITSHDVMELKPSREPVVKALEGLGKRSEEALMIGDSIYDIWAGNRAGVLTGWAAWGADVAPDFGPCPPDYTWEQPLDILNCLPGASA